MSVRHRVIWLAFLLAFVSQAFAQAPAIEAQSLIGEWSGDIKGPANLPYQMTLTRAEGNKLFGKAKAGTFPEYQIEGTLDGDVFKYRSLAHPLTVELVVTRDTMTGSGENARSGAVGKFSLTRKK